MRDIELQQHADDPALTEVDGEGKARKVRTVEEVKLEMEHRTQYAHLHDFSSELEFDERFDLDEYLADADIPPDKPGARPGLDRTLPAHARPNTKVQRRQNRAKLFDAYKKQVAERELADRRVTFAPEVALEELLKDPVKAEQNRKMELEVRKLLEEEKFAVNIRDFINEHYLYLPANQASGAYQLLKALQSKPYEEVEKNTGSIRRNMAFMNEERRKRLSLPPLTSIDYNCLERAGMKLKLVLDCLMLVRRISGRTVLPRDLVVTQLSRFQEMRRAWHVKNVLRQGGISRALFRVWGTHIQLESGFNPESAQVQASIKQIQAYQSNEGPAA